MKHADALYFTLFFPSSITSVYNLDIRWADVAKQTGVLEGSPTMSLFWFA